MRHPDSAGRSALRQVPVFIILGEGDTSRASTSALSSPRAAWSSQAALNTVVRPAAAVMALAWFRRAPAHQLSWESATDMSCDRRGMKLSPLASSDHNRMTTSWGPLPRTTTIRQPTARAATCRAAPRVFSNHSSFVPCCSSTISALPPIATTADLSNACSSRSAPIGLSASSGNRSLGAERRSEETPCRATLRRPHTRVMLRPEVEASKRRERSRPAAEMLRFARHDTGAHGQRRLPQ
ncbi:MAG: hypothetical protein K0Q71_878 [Thermomicrobiales bacterium]|nr:hypothetical protein [Thermomicrobiales bacterium]